MLYRLLPQFRYQPILQITLEMIRKTLRSLVIVSHQNYK